MARYFFHLRDGTDYLIDPEGTELPELEAAREMALLCARDTLSNELKDGLLDLRYRIDVEDAEGIVVHSLPLGSAFETMR